MHTTVRRGAAILRLAVSAVIAAGLLFAFTDRTYAQVSTGTIAGDITDTDGRAVVGASVILTNTTTGQRHVLKTNNTGHFAAALDAGVYTVEASAERMTSEKQTGVAIAAGQTRELTIRLGVAAIQEAVTVEVSPAVETAPSQPSLAARSAQSRVSEQFIEQNTAPSADFSQVLQAVPGMFSYSSNGPGLSDTKTFFRGFKDGQYNIAFDGIPFYDTNDPTHHSWVFFPTQFLGGTTVDRSPGSAASIGPTTFGGSVNLLSRNLSADPHIIGTASYGSFDTRLVNGEYQTGGSSDRFLVNAQDMRSDGYQTFNRQQRDAGSGKYEHHFDGGGTITAFSSGLRVVANTPDWKDPLRSQVDQFGPSYLMSNDPTQANYFGYEHYHVTTDFSYFGLRADLGGGWSIDDKVYMYGYHNHEHFNAQTGAITATSGTNKLNAYRTFGNILPLSYASTLGTFRTGLWSQFSLTNRYQTQENPLTFVDAALPNFHETFDTLSIQPYAEFEWAATSRLHITPGVKYSQYTQDFVQFADNGKTVGSLGGAPSISHNATYGSWLPSFDAHYMVRSNIAVYGQVGKGDAIPPTKVFDSKNAAVGVLPKPTLAETYQTGFVWEGRRVDLGFDVFRTRFDNTYTSTLNQDTGLQDFFAAGTSRNKGAELETNVAVGGGLSVYVNATMLRAQFTDTGLYVANSPKHTEALGINYARAGLTFSLFYKRAASMFNDNSSTHEAIVIAPVDLTSLSVGYRIRRPAAFSKEMLIRFGVQNVFDAHNIIAVSPASKSTSVPSPNDQVTLLAGRSASLTFTIDLARR